MKSTIAPTNAAAPAVARATPRSDSGLTDAMLARFAERAPGTTATTFFTEDFADLEQAGTSASRCRASSAAAASRSPR